MCVSETFIQRHLLIVPILLYGASCLTMESVVVPKYVLQDQPAELRCQFRLDQDSLYSVSWYKDHEEFYRYVPKASPRQHTYRLEGARVDQQRSDARVVWLRGARPAASGVYRCEVSAEAPSFTSVHGEGRMDVVSLPSEGPVISGDIYPRAYREGDILALNCSAGLSHPPAQISWLVNNQQVRAWFETEGGPDRGAVAGLLLQLEGEHFPQGEMAIRCVATVRAPDPHLLDTREARLFVRGSACRVTGSWLFYVFSHLLIHLVKIFWKFHT